MSWLVTGALDLGGRAVRGAYDAVRPENRVEKSVRCLIELKSSMPECTLDDLAAFQEADYIDSLEEGGKIEFILDGMAKSDSADSAMDKTRIYKYVVDLLDTSGDGFLIFNRMSKAQLKPVLDAAIREDDEEILRMFEDLPQDVRTELASDYLAEGNLDIVKLLITGNSTLQEGLGLLGKGQLAPIYLKACEEGDVEVVTALKGSMLLSSRGLGGNQTHFVDGFECACEHDKGPIVEELLEPEYGVTEPAHRGKFISPIGAVVRDNKVGALAVLKERQPKECLYAACKLGNRPLVGQLIEKFSTDRETLSEASRIARENGNGRIADGIDEMASYLEVSDIPVHRPSVGTVADRLIKASWNGDEQTIDEIIDPLTGNETFKNVFKFTLKHPFCAAGALTSACLGGAYAVGIWKTLTVVGGLAAYGMRERIQNVASSVFSAPKRICSTVGPSLRRAFSWINVI